MKIQKLLMVNLNGLLCSPEDLKMQRYLVLVIKNRARISLTKTLITCSVSE